MLRKLLYVVLLGALPFLNSCKGPDGPAGSSGAQGPPGVAGAPGAKGEPGTSGGGSGALQFTQDTLSSEVDGSFGLGFQLTNETASAIEKGVILVYAKSGGFWFPLPGFVFFGEEVTNFTYLYQVKDLVLSVIVLETAEKPTVRKFQSVRVVIVPASNVKGRLNAEIDHTNYEAVRKAYDLPE